MILASAIYPTYDPFGLFNDVKTVTMPEELTKDSFLLLHGGEDIATGIYKQEPNSYTDAKEVKSSRDKIEMALVNQAFKLKIPVIGICRGAQLLCAMNGGSLFQHVENHTRSHNVFTYKGEELITNSVHHQMMNVKETKHEMLAWSENLSKIYLGEDDQDQEHPDVDPEVVYFPKRKALAIQPHPEWLNVSHPFVQFCSKVIQEKFL